MAGALSRSEALRRISSSARLRATRKSQPAGLSGIEPKLHCCIAAISASCTTSSASGRCSAPKMRVSVATICPARWRNRWSMSTLVSTVSGHDLDLPDFDRAEVEVRAVADDAHRVVVVLRLDREVAAEDLLRLDER